jgi:hypothetical protein
MSSDMLLLCSFMIFVFSSAAIFVKLKFIGTPTGVGGRLARTFRISGRNHGSVSVFEGTDE